jgi:hypothetical protein
LAKRVSMGYLKHLSNLPMSDGFINISEKIPIHKNMQPKPLDH